MGLFSAIIDGIGSLANSATSAANSIANRKFMREQQEREFAQQNAMYDKQRSDALTDYATQRQDYVNDLLMSRSRDVQALQNAGLSTALAANQSVGGNALGSAVQQSSFASPNSIASQQPYQFEAPNLLFAAQLANLKADTQKKDAEAAKIKTEGDRAKADFENWQNVTKELMNDTMKSALTKLNSEKNKAWFESNEAANKYDFDMQEVDELDENGKPTGNKIRRYEQNFRNNMKQLQLQVDQMTFDYKKAKEFKPWELKQLQETINQITANVSLLKDKDEQQKILNMFNRAGIGIGHGMIDSLAALLYSNKGNELATRAVSTLTEFVKGIFTSMFKLIKGDGTSSSNGFNPFEGEVTGKPTKLVDPR
nr:MAG TPA: hypothetical protein [Microviridae sp.]